MRCISLLCVLLFLQVGFAQQTLLQEKLFKINIITPGISFEKNLSEKTSLYLESGLSFGFNIQGNETSYLFSPRLIGQYRNYYNLRKRQDKRKSIAGNSGGYFAAHGSYYFSPINNNNFVSTYDGATLGLLWGFQKSYQSGLNIGANAGAGYNFSSINENGFLPIINFSVGWVIF